MSRHPSGLSVRQPDLARSHPPRWAWQRRIVLGYLNLLIGNEGVGKGVLASWMFARLTRGELPGDLTGQPAMVGIIADEDSFDSVWTPRLHVAGADSDYIRHIEREDGWTVDLSEDREGLKLAAELENVRVLYLDALLDNLGVNVDDWRNKRVRAALQPARALAREFDIAVIGSMHPNKRADSFRQLVSGAAAFNALSRSSLLLAEHPEEDSRRVLVRGKGNLSMAPRAVEFEIDSARFTANGHDFNEPQARNFAESDLTVDDLIGDAPTVREFSRVADAAEIIEALLPRDDAWHAAKPILNAGEGDGLDERTMQRAKKRLGILHRRAQTFPAATEWSWPPTRDTHTSCSNGVASVASVASGKDPYIPTQDTHDIDDSENKRSECVVSGKASATGSENGRRDANANGLLSGGDDQSATASSSPLPRSRATHEPPRAATATADDERELDRIRAEFPEALV